MDPKIKRGVQTVIFGLLYVLLFLILMPSLIRLLDDRWGKILYGVLVAGAVGVAFRLRAVSRDLL